jgi:hypothetical protein
MMAVPPGHRHTANKHVKKQVNLWRTNVHTSHLISINVRQLMGPLRTSAISRTRSLESA